LAKELPAAGDANLGAAAAASTPPQDDGAGTRKGTRKGNRNRNKANKLKGKQKSEGAQNQSTLSEAFGIRHTKLNDKLMKKWIKNIIKEGE